MHTLKRCHEILEIKPGASFEEAKQAYRDMVSVWHPDRLQHSAQLLEKANRKIREINDAWEQLQEYFRKAEERAAKERDRKEREEAERARSERYDLKPVQRYSYPDLDLEPVVPVEQARQAYRDRATTRQGEQVRKTGDTTEVGRQRKDQTEAAGPRPEREAPPGQHKESRERQENEQKKRDDADKVKSVRKPAEQTGTTKPVDNGSDQERDNKLKLLSDYYLQGLREKNHLNMRDAGRVETVRTIAATREMLNQRKQAVDQPVAIHLHDPALIKETQRKNKLLSDYFLTKYNEWIAQEKRRFAEKKAEPAAPSKLGKLLKRTSRSGDFLHGIPNIKMMYVHGSSFLMGEDDPAGLFTKFLGTSNSHPRHRVLVPGFYIGIWPVTEKQWGKTMGVPVRSDSQDFPVLLNWDEVEEFIWTLNGITNLKFRLPTEAEWEYAARSCGEDGKWPGNIDTSAIRPLTPERVTVGQGKPNELGLYDMLGNVEEWVSDWYDQNYYRYSPEDAPQGPDEGDRKVIRGGVYRDSAGNYVIADACRRSFSPTSKSHRVGVRLAHPAAF